MDTMPDIVGLGLLEAGTLGVHKWGTAMPH